MSIQGSIRIAQKAMSPEGFFARGPAGKTSQLLHGEQGGAAGHQSRDVTMETAPLSLGEGRVTTGLHLGCQVKAGLIHAVGQHLAKHLQVERELPIKLRVGALQLTPNLQ